MTTSAVLIPLVAVFGTIAGSLTTGWLQARIARTTRQANRRDADRKDARVAIVALDAALAEHRSAMVLRETERLNGNMDAYERLRTHSHTTRAAISAPLATVRVLLPALATVARQAAEATYVMRNVADASTLQALRLEAIQAAEQLLTDARSELDKNA